MAESSRRRQHVVSAGYQRNFADGQFVSVLDAHDGRVLDARRSVRANWRSTDFASVKAADGTLDDSLEHEFSRLETVFLNVIREIWIDKPMTRKQRAAVDDLAAVHLARSFQFERAHQEIVLPKLSEDRASLVQNRELGEAFYRQHQREPRPGELQALVDRTTEAFLLEPRLFSDSIRRVLHGARLLLAARHVQLVGVMEDLPGFVLPDNAVLHGRLAVGTFGFLEAGAIGDSDIVIVPIGRRLVALYTAKALPHMSIRTKNSVRWINSLLLRSATNQVVCHPDDQQEVSRLVGNLGRYPPAKFRSVKIR